MKDGSGAWVDIREWCGVDDGWGAGLRRLGSGGGGEVGGSELAAGWGEVPVLKLQGRNVWGLVWFVRRGVGTLVWEVRFWV